MKEIWKPVPVPGCGHRYQVSNYGCVRNRRTEHLMKTRKNVIGGLTVNLTPEGSPVNKTYQVHRLVLLAFKPIPFDIDYYVKFRDDDPTNARLDNLEWTPRKESSNTKLKRDQVAIIRSRWMAGEPYSTIAPDFGVSIMCIHELVSGKTWSHVS